ncbi:MAG TPA: NrsF family protein, partial [Polyangiaceae bacterium]|nr:NrsF family protein [Polyangiaceae bacterium]
APQDDTKAAVMAQIALRPSPDRGVVVRTSLIYGVFSCLLAGAVFGHFGGIRVTNRPTTLLLGTTLGTTAVTLAVCGATFVNRRSSLPRPPRVLVPLLLAAPTAILIWKVGWSSQYLGALEPFPTRPGFRCLGLGLGLGAILLTAFLLASRASTPAQPALVGLAGGISVGCCSAVLTDLWCPVGYVPHLLLGHLLPIFVVGGLGALLGKYLLPLR